MSEFNTNEIFDFDTIKSLCDDYKDYNQIPAELYEKFVIKRGLRNADGTGVLAGLTHVCNVHGYVINESEKEPIDGQLIYRGINVNDIIDNCTAEERFGFEETVYLLLFGVLPNKEELAIFEKTMENLRTLPEGFFEDMILKAPSINIMNKLARSVLALYSYDDTAEDDSLEAQMYKSLRLIARMSNIMVKAYQVKNRVYSNESMILHQLQPNQSTAETILSLLRPDRKFTREEALLLDVCLILHAEHGGGNNSTFACRVLTSSATDAYSAYAAAIGSLKGPRHGGANIKTTEMLDDMKNYVKDPNSKEEVADYIRKLIRREAYDKTGLVYGMGHAVYTKSDPRTLILKERAMKLAKGTSFENDFIMLQNLEELTPVIFAEETKKDKVMCANVDLYSGLVYRMLGIPEELFTPIFATARMPGWSAHRMEEMISSKRIIRPAYKTVAKAKEYIPIDKRG